MFPELREHNTGYRTPPCPDPASYALTESAIASLITPLARRVPMGRAGSRTRTARPIGTRTPPSDGGSRECDFLSDCAWGSLGAIDLPLPSPQGKRVGAGAHYATAALIRCSSFCTARVMKSASDEPLRRTERRTRPVNSIGTKNVDKSFLALNCPIKTLKWDSFAVISNIQAAILGCFDFVPIAENGTVKSQTKDLYLNSSFRSIAIHGPSISTSRAG